MEVWGVDSAEALRTKWGSEAGLHLNHFATFMLRHRDIHKLMMDAGLGDHPAIVESGAILEQYYTGKEK